MEFPIVTCDLGCRRTCGSDLESVISDLGTDLVHPLFSPLRLRRVGLLLDDLIVINVGGLVILLLIVEFRDAVGVLYVEVLQRFEVVLGLRHFFAGRISQQKVFERFLCAHRGGLIVTGSSTRLEVNIGDLVHGVRSDIAIRISVDHLLVSIDGGGDRPALFKRLADAILG